MATYGPIFVCAAFVLVAFLAGRQDVSIVQLAGFCLLLFAAISFFTSWIIAPFLNVLERVWSSKKPVVGEEELRARQKEAIDLAQTEHNEKAQLFAERQAEFLRRRAAAKSDTPNSASSWGGKGRVKTEQSLAEKEDSDVLPVVAGSREEALTVTLSPEPSEGCSGATNLVFRLPNGTIKRRLFMVTASCQELYAYIERLGFLSEKYILYTLRPRQLIPCVVDSTVEAFSPGRGVAVVVEERET